MNNTSVILSISMLVSGQKKDMLKSLESLHYFKDAFPCEIILVDTGCNSEQRAIVEQYGDKVIDFAWCNDFAAARNAGLKEARGEWFLYLDDDEWFDNPREIISFFQSGEYRHYNSALYMVRNYSDAQGTICTESFASRMVRLSQQTVFVGKIHERLEPFFEPRKTFSDYVHHYGYVYENEEQRKEHAHRNILLLQEMCIENPGDLRWVAHLAQDYFSIQEYGKVLETCTTGLEEWNALKDQGIYAPVFVGATYAYILISLETMQRYDEEKEWLEKAFADPIVELLMMKPTVAFYCMVAARLYSQLGEYFRCREYFKKYLDYKKELGEDREALELGTAAIVAGVFQEQLLYGTVLMCLGAIIRTEDLELVEKTFYLLDWKDRRLLRQQMWELDMLDACCSVEYHPVWGRIMQTLVTREGGMEEMHVVFLKTEIDYQNQKETEKILRLHRIVAELDCENHYILYTKILWNLESNEASEQQKRARAIELFEQLFQKYPEKLLETRADVWDAGEQLDVVMEDMLLQVNFSTWRREVQQWIEEASIDSIRRWDRRVAAWKKKADIRYDYFSMKCLEGYLRNYRKISGQGEEFIAQLERLLWKYSESTLEYYGKIYKKFVFQGTPMILPDEAQLGLALSTLRECREEGRDRAALSQLQKCVGIYAELEAAIEYYARLLGELIKQREAEAQAAKEELIQLARTLGQVARQHIQEGNLSVAEKVLQQICQCVPGDEEAEQMLKQLQERTL